MIQINTKQFIFNNDPSHLVVGGGELSTINILPTTKSQELTFIFIDETVYRHFGL